MLKIIGTALLSAVLTSFFWIWFYNFVPSPKPEVARRGNVVVVKPTDAAPVGISQQVVVGPAGLALPVMGIKTEELVDTYDAARGSGRKHDAIDIMAPTGRPIVSSAPGTVEKLFFSRGGGGISLYVRSLDGKWIYYYAHLNAYAPGLHEGQQVKRGQLLGFVGFSGNADPAGPHLHMAINRMGPGEKWYQGTPVNPYPLLAGNAARR